MFLAFEDDGRRAPGTGAAPGSTRSAGPFRRPSRLPFLAMLNIAGVMTPDAEWTADAVIMDSSLRRVDEFLHISGRMRTIALQSALGGMALSAAGMLFAATGSRSSSSRRSPRPSHAR